MKSKTIVKLGTVPHDVVDLIDYQPDAIVSREIVKGETGSVTVFAFDALVQVLDGETQITIAGKAHTVKAGQLDIMAA
jgi:quercetin dioxygenase-like cupin family protein